MPGSTEFDAVFVGGGVIGLAGAWRSARAGLSVAVVDPEPGHGATWAAAGMLAPVTEAHYGEEALVRLNLAAARLWPDFARELEAESALPVGYLRRGTVVVAADASDRLAIDEVLAFQQRLGLDATRLSARECRALEPLLAPGLRGGVDVPGDHQVDNRLLVPALLGACRASGVSLVAGRAAGVAVSPGPRAVGVDLEGCSTLQAGAVVVTAGCHSHELGGVPPGILPPVRPVKGMTLRLNAPPGVPRLGRTLRGMVHGESCYLVPRDDGSVVIGATVEEKGFDRTVQAGPLYQLLRDARTILPGLDEYELAETAVGLRPGSPDNAPAIGATGIPGLFVATGHYRNGILLAPLTAEAITGLLTGSAPSDVVAPFGPERFASPRSGAA
ncbi:MAG TPA: glycine oxidase ThiO [Acidimicrobiales bacterium]|nr:glycine oxidase ThiO [Acidimicrobiales bacterium]